MLKEEGDHTAITISPCIAAAWPSWCDSCRSVPCSIYCRADTAYLCGGCDTSIHSANSLARRHHRVPFQPLPTPPRKFAMLMEEKEEENGGFIGGEVDEYLDLVEFSSCEDEGKVEEKEKQKGCDTYEGRDATAGVVPVKCLVGGGEEDQLLQSFQMGFGGFHGGMDYCSTTASSLGHNVPLSSMETAGAAESAMIGISSSHMMTSKGTMELFSGPHLQMPQAFSPMDREARVLRYREKKKTRKFQKIIRYASRKAYAETRPRIKGRFAKRTTDAGHEADQMFAAPVMIEASYGAVPSY